MEILYEIGLFDRVYNQCMDHNNISIFIAYINKNEFIKIDESIYKTISLIPQVCKLWNSYFISDIVKYELFKIKYNLKTSTLLKNFLNINTQIVYVIFYNIFFFSKFINRNIINDSDKLFQRILKSNLTYLFEFTGNLYNKNNNLYLMFKYKFFHFIYEILNLSFNIKKPISYILNGYMLFYAKNGYSYTHNDSNLDFSFKPESYIVSNLELLHDYMINCKEILTDTFKDRNKNRDNKRINAIDLFQILSKRDEYIKNIDKEVIHPIYIGLTHKYMVSLVDKFFDDNHLNVIENWFSFFINQTHNLLKSNMICPKFLIPMNIFINNDNNELDNELLINYINNIPKIKNIYHKKYFHINNNTSNIISDINQNYFIYSIILKNIIKFINYFKINNIEINYKINFMDLLFF